MSLDVQGRRPPSEERPRQPKTQQISTSSMPYLTSQEPPPPEVEPQQIDSSVMTIQEGPVSPPPVEGNAEIIPPVPIPLCRITTVGEDAGQVPSDPRLGQWRIHPIDLDLDRIVTEPTRLTWQQQVQELPLPDLCPLSSLSQGPL